MSPSLPSRMLGLLLALAAPLVASPAARSAEFVLLVEPTFPARQLQEVHAPLIDYLNRSTGHRFVIRSAANFNEHWRELRAGSTAHFVFEEGHFFDYRNQRSGFLPLVRTIENSAFAIVAADPEIIEEGRGGVVGRTVASLGAPNLGNLLVFDSFQNPLAQPELRAISSKWSDGPDLIFSGDVDAALLPSYLSAENPATTEVWRSRDVPGRVLSAAPTVPAEVRQAVAEAMLRVHEDTAAFPAMHELRTERFVPATAAEYRGMERLLSATFGYVPPRPAEATPPAPAPTVDPAATQR